MTSEEAKELLPVFKAFAEGKTIQIFSGKEWITLREFKFDKSPKRYRIKPEPKYRPFKNQEECWNEMMKHQPFGWIKALDGELFCIDKVFRKGITYKHSSCWFEEYLEGDYTFADGEPFGIKED